MIRSLSLADQVKAVEAGLTAVCGFSRDRLIHLVRGQMGKNSLEQALAVTFYRMHQWAEALVKLQDRYYFQVAQAASRSIFELLMDIQLLVADKSLIAKYSAHPGVQRYHIAAKLAKFLADNPIVDTTPYVVELSVANDLSRKVTVEATCVSNWGATKKQQPKWPDHWSGMDAFKRAQKLGLQFEEWYRAYYSIQSLYVHPGATAFYDASSELLTMAYTMALAVSTQFYTMAAETVAEQFHVFEADSSFRDELGRASVTAGAVAAHLMSLESSPPV